MKLIPNGTLQVMWFFVIVDIILLIFTPFRTSFTLGASLAICLFSMTEYSKFELEYRDKLNYEQGYLDGIKNRR